MAEDGGGKATTVLGIDIDAKKSISELNDLYKKITDLGDAKNLSGLISSIKSVSVVLAGVGAAAWVVHQAFEMVFEAEKIKIIEKQFENLTETFGLAGETIKNGLNKELGEFMHGVEQLEVANKAINRLEGNAQKLPEIAGLVRKMALTSGQDMAEVFDNLTMAISSGNKRMFRRLGLMVDVEGAEKKFAAAAGLSVKELSEFGKQQAILNAALEAGNKRYKDNAEAIAPLTTSWKKFKVGVGELYEVFVLLVDKVLGKQLSAAVSYFADAVKSAHLSLKQMTGTEAQAEEARVEKARMRAKELEEMIQNKEKFIAEQAQRSSAMGSRGGPMSPTAAAQEKIKAAEKEHDELKRMLWEYDQLTQAQERGEIDNSNKTKDAKIANAEEVHKFRTQYERDLMALQKEVVETNWQSMATDYEFEVAYEQKRMLMEDEHNQRLTEMAIKYKEHKDMLAQLTEQENIGYKQRELEFEKTVSDEKMRMYENELKAAKTTGQGVASAFKQGAAQAQKDMNDFGKRGQRVFGTVKGNAANAFKAMGDGSKNAGEAMRGFMFGSIADIAEAEGQLMLAKGIGSYDPIAIAEGGILIALSGALRAQADGKSKGIGSAGGGGGGGTSAASSAPESKPEMIEQPKKAVTVQIMGHLFETEQTKQRLLEMIREQTDATDFKYQQIT
jgi:hypothetical protein